MPAVRSARVGLATLAFSACARPPAGVSGAAPDPCAPTLDVPSGCTTVDVLPVRWGYSFGLGIDVTACFPCGEGGDGGITVQGFEVELAYPYEPGDEGYDADIDALVGAASGYFLPAGFAAGGGGCADEVFVTLLPVQVLRAIAEQVACGKTQFVIVATLRAVGERGGDRVEWGSFVVPIHVCCGCLAYGVDPPLGCDDPPPDDLHGGDPKSGLPICEPVTCCWDGAGDADVLRCPHPAALE